MATRKFKVTHVAYITFLLDTSVLCLEEQRILNKIFIHLLRGEDEHMHGYCGWFRPKSAFIWPSFHRPTEQKRRVERVEIPHGITTVQGRSRG